MSLHASNPLADAAATDADDRKLVLRARSGERAALEELVQRHQRWIYNIAIRMLHHPQDAEDATQEVLLKALTHLATFAERSSFRTWLYRIVVNHVLNRKRGRSEAAVTTFGAYGNALDDTPDADPPDPGGAEGPLLVAEAMIACTSGMLLCLDREQRLAYVLGEILEVSDVVAAELLEITREAFRQRLTRARRDLASFMNDKCGLVNPANPCRCAKKTRGFIAAGHVDAANLLFARERVERVRDVVPKTFATIRTLDERCASVYRDHPFHEPPDQAAMLRRLLESPELKKAADL